MKIPAPVKGGQKPLNKDSRSVTHDERSLIEICVLAPQEALARLGVTAQGLEAKEAASRLDEYGLNDLAHAARLGFWADIFRRLRNPLNIQLFLIAAISGAIGELKSTFIVSAMIVLSLGLSYILDRRSGRAVETLGKRVQSRSIVLRDGQKTEIAISEIVPGDIVLLQAGSIVPADLRLLSAKDFFVSESVLTGESMAVEKSAVAETFHGQNTTELANICFYGTNVTSGTAHGLVINTGRRTAFGAISESLVGQREETSFDHGVRSFTWLMIKFMVVMVSAVFFIVGLSKGNWTEALLFGLSIAVGLTPEMLPMIVTVNLAKGALTMAKKKVIVKRLPSIQNLGAIDILCTDKTGTLTQDRVVLERHLDITGHTSEDVLSYVYLNSYYQTGLRSLIDRAVLDSAVLDAEANCRLVDELPFDFQRRRMSVVVDYENDHVLICKGAVEEIYECCGHYQIGDEVFPLIPMIRDNLFEEVDRLNKDGFRVLGVAYQEFPREKATFATTDERNLILLGYIAFYDPPKPSALEAIGQLRDAGVKVKVLTGDNALVTRKVCRDVSFKIEKLVTGAELAALSDLDFKRVVEEVDVFVKLSPAQKEQIVRQLRENGHVVGFMGDGINDAPALKAADVGISVDSAVDVAKEAADIILLEKSLLVLEEGIIEGRRVFANIVKYIRMGASSNFGNMFSVLGASYLFPFLPMLPVQILANNLLYDFSQTGIPTDNVDEELVAKPLKWDITNIKRFMMFIGPISSVFDYATYALMWYFFGCSAFNDPQVAAASKEGLARLFQTGWFVESLLTQTLIVHIIRTKRIPFFGSQASWHMTLTTLLIMAIAVWLPYSPFAKELSLVALPPVYWLWITGFLLCYSIMTHYVKTWFFKRYGGE
ncbi:MAG: magnesium-translocating P-type ATPase [Deltaproteobacteria bacterium RIFOXYD12_FULL_55_16]|nr:MAG: magnesium-translocating P-type ATPase [Deltaproteobacteria bacterium RIFOXYD12_FULL_55_16]